MSNPSSTIVDTTASVPDAAGEMFARLEALDAEHRKVAAMLSSARQEALFGNKGGIQKVTWSVESEYDDQGGYYNFYESAALHLQCGRRIHLGRLHDFDAIDEFMGELEEDDPLLEQLEAKLDAAPEDQALRVFHEFVCGMAGMTEQIASSFIAALEQYIDEHLDAEELDFTTAEALAATEAQGQEG